MRKIYFPASESDLSEASVADFRAAKKHKEQLVFMVTSDAPRKRTYNLPMELRRMLISHHNDKW